MRKNKEEKGRKGRGRKGEKGEGGKRLTGPEKRRFSITLSRFMEQIDFPGGKKK